MFTETVLYASHQINKNNLQGEWTDGRTKGRTGYLWTDGRTDKQTGGGPGPPTRYLQTRLWHFQAAYEGYLYEAQWHSGICLSVCLA